MSAFDRRSPEDMAGMAGFALASHLEPRFEADRKWRNAQVGKQRMHPGTAARLNAMDAEVLRRLRATDAVISSRAA